MPDEPKTLSYEVLEDKLSKANDKIATLEAELEDMKKVIKLNLSSKSTGQGDNVDKDKITKEKFEGRLKEDLGLC